MVDVSNFDLHIADKVLESCTSRREQSQRMDYCHNQWRTGNRISHRTDRMTDSKKSLSACCVTEKHALPVMLVACKNEKEINMPVYSAFVGGQGVKAPRNTGCSTDVVKRALVEDANMTGESKLCVLVDGTVREFPTANITIDTPFYRGQVKATCMERPV